MTWADLILAMGASVLEALQELADDQTAPNLALYLDDQDVPDPWGRPYEAFTDCVTLIESGAQHHL